MCCSIGWGCGTFVWHLGSASIHVHAPPSPYGVCVLPVALLLTASALICRLFACLVMASKVWDDLSMWNVVSGVSAVSLHRLVLSGDVRF
jgi:uncharacterized membrane protein